ncbi:Uncharacterised protein [Klebsiella pneumoniae]|nr:Uncharacterised protein [Klebsiella pneumoniae]SLP16018.1 Uncharacterised protein [Klebsiella pneumoniae]SLP17406.1 Uncharacterised protein [Klebsiella pneumoniae]SLP18853.1 Uncharacterised protein [Klebsiella pneumoniae]SSH29744.1 Uncharacterised protein [Klebsiella pneumoniae]
MRMTLSFSRSLHAPSMLQDLLVALTLEVDAQLVVVQQLTRALMWLRLHWIAC